MSDDDQQDLFGGDPPLRKRRFPKLNKADAEKARDDAMEHVGGAAMDDGEIVAWRLEYMGEIKRRASEGTPFLAEDVTAKVGIPETIDSRAIGPLFRAMQNASVIVPTGRIVNGQSVTRHRTMMREWVGTE